MRFYVKSEPEEEEALHRNLKKKKCSILPGYKQEMSVYTQYTKCYMHVCTFTPLLLHM